LTRSGGARTWGTVLDGASVSYCGARGGGPCPPRCLPRPLRPCGVSRVAGAPLVAGWGGLRVRARHQLVVTWRAGWRLAAVRVVGGSCAVDHRCSHTGPHPQRREGHTARGGLEERVLLQDVEINVDFIFKRRLNLRTRRPTFDASAMACLRKFQPSLFKLSAIVYSICSIRYNLYDNRAE
jgi:hypothetical protein